MRLALLQLNPTVGAVEHNADAVLKAAHEAHQSGAQLALAPELALVGYPPRDLLDRPALSRAVESATRRVIAEAPTELALIFGTLGGVQGDDPVPLTGQERMGDLLGNDAVVALGGREIARARKQLLPTYDVFDEARHFHPGHSTCITNIHGARVAVTICEDAWSEETLPGARYRAAPLHGLSPDNCDLIVNLSASPFTLPKFSKRQEVFANAARSQRVPIALANQIGGNDELIFDGQSSVWDAQGTLLARAAAFREAVLLCSTEAPGTISSQPATDTQALYEALVLGIRDYAGKCGFRSAVLGLSGGVDSALVATLAADALGADNVTGVAMPTRYSSEGSLTDARALADNLGIELHTVDIDPVFAAYLQTLSPALDAAEPARDGETTFENLQARIRCATVMAFSNRTGALLLTTGNKSELAVGYCTLYGDMAGGLGVINDLPKTAVYRVCEWVNAAAGKERIPVNSITKPPSAELRPDQQDSDSLPPYEILDKILHDHIEEGLSSAEIVAAGLDASTVRRIVRMVAQNEYKRRQAPPGLIVTGKAFGPGRRMPLAKGLSEL